MLLGGLAVWSYRGASRMRRLSRARLTANLQGLTRDVTAESYTQLTWVVVETKDT